MFKEYPDILTPKEAACALGISQASVYKLVRQQASATAALGGKLSFPSCA